METVVEKLSPLIPESRTTQAILIGALVGVIIYQLTKKRYKLPPGPWGPPLIGNLLSLRKDPLYRKLVEWEKTYGPVITFKMGPMKMVILNNLDTIQEAFVKKSTDFAGRPQFYSMVQFSEGGKDIVMSDYSPTWQLHRRLALKALGHYMKGNNFQQTLDDVLEKVVEGIREEEGSFDMKLHIELMVFNVLSKVCFNEQFPKGDKEFERFMYLLDQGNKEFGNGFFEDIFPPLRWCPTPKYRRFVANFNELLVFLYKRINQHRDTFNPDVKRDFTDAILISQKEAEIEENPELLASFTNTHVAQTISDVFQAGIDTSRQTLYWTVLYIAAHPEVQAKIHEEVDRVMGSRRSPMLSDRHQLAYTEAVLFESMRIATVGPFAVPRTTTCDTTIGDYELPKGTIVMPNVWAVHHDPKLFEDPDTFKPERFLQNDRSHRPEGWMPFSVGKRACMAKSLAEPELHLLLAGLYRNFRIDLPEGVSADLEADADSGLGYLTKEYKVVVKYRNN